VLIWVLLAAYAPKRRPVATRIPRCPRRATPAVGPVAETTAAIAQMALGLTQDMLNEKPPDDGHRLNILSSSFQIIGIAVFRDSSGTVWMTQDFAT
jgi:hypothetical protein